MVKESRGYARSLICEACGVSRVGVDITLCELGAQLGSRVLKIAETDEAR